MNEESNNSLLMVPTSGDNPQASTSGGTPVDVGASNPSKEGDQSPPILAVHNFFLTWANGVTLFNNFDIEFPDIPGQSQIYAIMGASGCGKSTLIKCILGSDEVNVFASGEILHKGNPLDEKVYIPFVSQNRTTIPWKTVWENVAYDLKRLKLKKEEIKERVGKVLSIVGLSEHAFKYPSQLSGGQQQRLAIAAAVVSNPELIILDEPLSSQDPITTKEMLKLLMDVFVHLLPDATVIIVTHKPEVAAFANIVYQMGGHPSRIINKIEIDLPQDGSVDEIMATDQFSDIKRQIQQGLEKCKQVSDDESKEKSENVS